MKKIVSMYQGIIKKDMLSCNYCFICIVSRNIIGFVLKLHKKSFVNGMDGMQEMMTQILKRLEKTIFRNEMIENMVEHCLRLMQIFPICAWMVYKITN